MKTNIRKGSIVMVKFGGMFGKRIKCKITGFTKDTVFIQRFDGKTFKEDGQYYRTMNVKWNQIKPI